MDGVTKTQRILEGAARWLVIIAVVLSPWLIGSADPGAYLFIGGIVGLGTQLWLLSLVCARNSRLREPLVTLAGGALLAFVMLQATPLPHGAVAVLNPFSAETSGAARDILKRMDVAHDTVQHVDFGGIPSALSLAPAATTESLYLFIVYLGCFMVLANTIRDWRQLHRFCSLLVLFGFVMAVLGMVHKFSGSAKILWFHEPRFGGEIFGPFTNRNHFAAYMNMLTGVGVGLFLSSREIMDVMAWKDWRERLNWLSSKSASRIALTAFAIVLMIGATFVSLSRGGMLSIGVSGFALVAFFGWRHRRSARMRSAIAAAVLLLAAGVLWFGRGEAVERLATLTEVAQNPLEDYRTIVTMDTLRLFAACPLTGCGFGAFRHAFTRFQSPSLELRWLHAHNDWVQLLAEGGLVGLLLFTLVLLLWGRGLHRRFPGASSRSRLLTLGLLLGLCTIALHSLVDYSLHKPAVALLMATLAGLAVSAGYLRSRRLSPEQRRAGMERATVSGPGVRVIALILLIALSALFLSRRGDLRGELAFARFLYFQKTAALTEPGSRQPVIEGAYREAEQFMRSAHHNPDALADVAGGLLSWSMDPALERPFRIRLAQAAHAGAALAAYVAPSNYLPWLWLARIQLAGGAVDEAEQSIRRARDLVSHRHQVRMFNVVEEEAPGDTDPATDPQQLQVP